jgi:hypothetical protein
MRYLRRLLCVFNFHTPELGPVLVFTEGARVWASCRRCGTVITRAVVPRMRLVVDNSRTNPADSEPLGGPNAN